VILFILDFISIRVSNKIEQKKQMNKTFGLSTRDPTTVGAEYDVDDAVAYAQRRAADDRIRRQVEQLRRDAAANYWRENLDRVKGASRGNYCQKKYGEQARLMNAQAIFKDEECVGLPQPTYREHPDFPGMRVEDVCTLCVRDQARAILNERGEVVASEYLRKSRINRGTGAGEEEEEYEQIRTPPMRTVRNLPPRMQPPSAAVRILPRPVVVDERRKQLYAQRERGRESARQTADSSRPQMQAPVRFGMRMFTNNSPAPKCRIKVSSKKSKKKKKLSKQKKRTTTKSRG
jgi:hypothetical protein